MFYKVEPDKNLHLTEGEEAELRQKLERSGVLIRLASGEWWRPSVGFRRAERFVARCGFVILERR